MQTVSKKQRLLAPKEQANQPGQLQRDRHTQQCPLRPPATNSNGTGNGNADATFQEPKRYAKIPPRSDDDWARVKELVDKIHMQEGKTLKQTVEKIEEGLRMSVL